ncbi:hypothetical protein [Piscinibacter sp.]|uniref:hypothetical protein n=1 Tax=Piscinibacter sp. TaxID=1903157 RepID=UPI0039E6EB47
MFALRFTGCSVLALGAGLAFYLAPLKPGVLALQLAFTPQAFARIIHAWPPEHLARYRAHLPLDFALLLGYGAFGFLLATRTDLFSRSSPRRRRLAAWTLPLAAVFDAAENVLHWWLTAEPRFGLASVYAVAALASAAKWALLVLFGVGVAGALVRREAA